MKPVLKYACIKQSLKYENKIELKLLDGERN